MSSSDDAIEKAFNEQDKEWNAPRYFVTAIITLFISISIIYYCSSLTGCSLQVVP
jgi:hypothetical protein